MVEVRDGSVIWSVDERECWERESASAVFVSRSGVWRELRARNGGDPSVCGEVVRRPLGSREVGGRVGGVSDD